MVSLLASQQCSFSKECESLPKGFANFSLKILLILSKFLVLIAIGRQVIFHTLPNANCTDSVNSFVS